jgi:hypothetical protein
MFTYQGRLSDTNGPVNGTNDFQFALYDAAAGGLQLGSAVNADNVPVGNGLFTVNLDFGPDPFTGAARWLRIGVRPGGGAGAYTLLTPRQRLTPVPYAIWAANASAAANVPWSGVTGIPAGFTDGVDNDTTYGAGSGLNLGSGNLFSVLIAGNGTSSSAARSDHDHLGQSWGGAITQGLSVTTTLASGTGVAGLLGRQGAGSGSSGSFRPDYGMTPATDRASWALPWQ